MTNKPTACRLVMEVPPEVARMSQMAFEAYVHAHWAEWQDRWRQVGGNRAPGEMVKVSGGEPIYLIEHAGRHYLLTEGTRIVFAAVA